MTGEFRTAKGWRIFIYTFSPLFIAVFVYMGFTALSSETSNLTVKLILIPISLVGTTMFTYGLAETIKGRLIIKSNSISNLSLFGVKTLDFAEVKGFRIDSNYIHLVPNKEGKKSIKVSTYTEKSDQIINWLFTNFTDLDSVEAKAEEEQILASNELGIDTRTREYRLNEARRIAKYINIIGGVTGLWLWFYPRPYLISISVGMILPAIAFGSLFIYRGLIRLDERKNSAYPSIAYGFLAPSAGLLIRAVMDYDILDYKNLWITICVASVSLTCIFLLVTKEIKFTKFIDYLTTLSLAVMILCYSFGTYVVSNCLFDQSDPDIFTAEVVDKEISSGKSTTYYLILEPWGPRTEAEKVSVTKGEYESTNEGDTVDIYLKRGLLNTPWFYVVTE